MGDTDSKDTIEKYTQEARQGKQFDGSTKIKVGEKRCETTVFMKRADKIPIVGYLASQSIEFAVGNLAKRTNRAMEPKDLEVVSNLGDRKLEERIKNEQVEMSPTYPIEKGDVIEIEVTGYRYFDENNEFIPVPLNGSFKVIAANFYEITQPKGSSELFAEPWYPHEEFRKLLEPKQPKCVGELIGAKYFDENGEAYGLPYLEKDGKYIPLEKLRQLNVTIRIKQHVKGHDKEGKKIFEGIVVSKSNLDLSQLSKSADKDVENFMNLGEELDNSGILSTLKEKVEEENKKRITARLRKLDETFRFENTEV